MVKEFYNAWKNRGLRDFWPISAPCGVFFRSTGRPNEGIADVFVVVHGIIKAYRKVKIFRG